MKKIICLFIGFLLICVLLSSCNPESQKWPYNYGDSIWVGDKYQAYIYVQETGLSNQEFGTILLNDELIEVVYVFTPGQVDICYYQGDNVKTDKYTTLNSFCAGNTSYDSNGKAFSVEIYSSNIACIPIGETITFKLQTDEAYSN